MKRAKKVPVSHRTLRFSPCPARSGSPNRRRKETRPGRAGFRSEPYSGQPAGTIFSGRQLYISMYQAHSQPESSYPRFAACNLRPRVRSAPYRKSPTPERTSCGKTGSIENRGPGRKTYAPRHGNRRKRSLGKTERHYQHTLNPPRERATMRNPTAGGRFPAGCRRVPADRAPTESIPSSIAPVSSARRRAVPALRREITDKNAATSDPTIERPTVSRHAKRFDTLSKTGSNAQMRSGKTPPVSAPCRRAVNRTRTRRRAGRTDCGGP